MGNFGFCEQNLVVINMQWEVIENLKCVYAASFAGQKYNMLWLTGSNIL